jgi:hypothetical protein
MAEFHDSLVLSFPPERIRRIVLRVPERTLAFTRVPLPSATRTDWRPDTGTDARDVDLSRFNDLVKQLAELRTSKFLQYDGPIPVATGLRRPRLMVELDEDSGNPPHVLKIGETNSGLVLATTGTADTGPVFVLPAAAWNALIPAPGFSILPANLFAPER